MMEDFATSIIYEVNVCYLYLSNTVQTKETACRSSVDAACHDLK